MDDDAPWMKQPTEAALANSWRHEVQRRLIGLVKEHALCVKNQIAFQSPQPVAAAAAAVAPDSAMVSTQLLQRLEENSIESPGRDGDGSSWWRLDRTSDMVELLEAVARQLRIDSYEAYSRKLRRGVKEALQRWTPPNPSACASCRKFRRSEELRQHPIFHRLRLCSVCTGSEYETGCFEAYKSPHAFAMEDGSEKSSEKSCRICGFDDGGDLIVCEECPTSICTGCMPIYCPGYGEAGACLCKLLDSSHEACV